MNTTLTKSDREKILHKLMEHRFAKEQAKIDKDKVALAEAVYIHIYDDATRRKLAAAPDGWFPTAERLKARFGSDDRTYSLSKRRPILFRHYSSYNNATVATFSAIDPIAETHSDIVNRQRDLDNERDALSGKTKAKLETFRTVERLVREWPEVKKFIPPITKIQLPAIPVKDLNAAIGLKSAG